MKSMHRRIAVTLCVMAAVLAVLSCFFAMRLAITENMENTRDDLYTLLDYAAKNDVDDEDLMGLSKASGARLIRMNEDGEILYDTADKGGYYLDQSDVADAMKKGRGEQIQFAENLTLEFSLSELSPDGNILRIIKTRKAFSNRNYAVLGGFTLIWLAAAVYIGVRFAKKTVEPIRQISDSAKDMVSGKTNVNLRRIESYQEISTLLQTLRDMNAHLNDTVEKLRKKSAELESIIGHMRSGLIAVDGQLKVVQMNSAAKHLLGVIGEPAGKHVLEATGNTKLEDGLKEAVEHDELYTVELPVRIASEQRQLRLYVSPLEQENESIGAVALIEDITELRNLEQMRTDFAANVTHEMKTPLTSIQGFVETLQAGAVENPEMAHHFLDIIESEADRLSRLINDILSLSSMENGRVRVPTERLDLSKYASDVCMMLENSARQKNITLQMIEGEDCFITANQDHVKQLLINLTDNAIKYTLEGGMVQVSTEREGDNVLYKVRDTGIGIAQEHIPRLFERFYRVDKGRSRNMGGTGLGLAIVKHIVMDMDGTIDVQSELGVGTEFTVTLPYVPENK